VTNTQEKQFKGGNISFSSWFQRFLSMIGWLHCFGSNTKQKNHGREYMVDLVAVSKQRVREEGVMDKISLKGTAPVTYSQQPDPTSHCLPTIPSNYESINELIC
jgi:hypothetical protein